MKFRIILILCLAFSVLAGDRADPQNPAASSIVASTAWTAAYVRAAGIEDYRVIAPYELQHPPEYEIRPGDIKIIAGAKIFVYAGYENMMKILADKISAEKTVMVKIQTDYDPDNMKQSILAIAAAAGTRQLAEINIAALERTLAACREELRVAGLPGKTAVVHSFQKRLAELFGMTAAGTFGPAPLEAKQIADLTRARPALVIDNWHNPVSAPLKETLPGAAFAAFINFPGKDGTRTLIDVLRYNKDRLLEAWRAR